MGSDLAINDEYRQWLTEVKAAIQQSQIKAALSVNTELLRLYWLLGAKIVEKQQTSAWGSGFLQQLSQDLRSEFPDLKGLSRTNLAYIRQWYLFYHEHDSIVPQVVEQLDDPAQEQVVPQQIVPQQIVPQPVGQLNGPEYEEILQIPWGHNREIISKCQSVPEALYYVRSTIQNNWSRAVLVHQIESQLYQREGKLLDEGDRKLLSNFERTLPKVQSDLAQQTLKDLYIFDFLQLSKEYTERELESALVEHITKFLLELGAGFSYMGRQVHLEVGGQDFHIDLLFYHVRLHCYVVVELQVDSFQPEYAGKLNFFLSAVDDQLRHDLDQPTIGILICKDKNKTIAEYALRDIHKPIGVSEYQLTQALPDDLKSSLPSIEEIERQLENLDEES